MAADPFDEELRTHLQTAINDAIAGLEFSHSQLLGQRVSALHTPGSEDAFLPALLCAFTAQSLGASNEVALAAATSIALVEAAAYVVDDLVIAGSGSDVEPRGLITNWGMPRTLNAADGFFALAQSSLMTLTEQGLTAQNVLTLSDEMNEGCRAWAEECDARFAAEVLFTQHPSPALLRAAARLGAVAAGVENENELDLISQLVVSGDASLLPGMVGLNPAVAAQLLDASTYLAGVQPA